MTTIKLMILEDKRFLAEDLVDRLSDYELMGPFASGEDALEAAEDELPDIGVFDIELKGTLTGIDVAERINKTKVIPIIYLTKIQDDNAIFERISSAEFPVFFVSKPVSNNELRINLNNAIKAMEDAGEVDSGDSDGPVDVLNDRMFLRNVSGVFSVGVEDLIYVEADGQTTRVYSANHDRPIVVSTHLGEFLDKMGGMTKNIIRINRSMAVNILKILQIKDDSRVLSGRKQLILKGIDEPLTLTSKYKRDLMARFRTI